MQSGVLAGWASISAFPPVVVIPFLGNELPMPFEQGVGLHNRDDFGEQFAQNLAFFGQCDPFLVMESPMRGVTLQQRAVGAVFFKDILQFSKKG